MPRKRRSDSEDYKEEKSKRQREKELIDLIPKPKDRTVPMITKETNLKWEQFNQKRLEVVEDLLQIAKDHKAIVDAQKKLSPDKQDLRVLVATLKEYRLSVEALGRSIDDSCKDFYDPNEASMDNTIEIIIRHEEE
jgi:hypothetical protein